MFGSRECRRYGEKTYYDKSTMANGDVRETRYSFNDADHAEWNKKPYKAKAVFAYAFYLGCRYFITTLGA